MGKKAIREIDNMSLIKNIFKRKMNNQRFCLIVKTYKERDQLIKRLCLKDILTFSLKRHFQKTLQLQFFALPIYAQKTGMDSKTYQTKTASNSLLMKHVLESFVQLFRHLNQVWSRNLWMLLGNNCKYFLRKFFYGWKWGAYFWSFTSQFISFN